jgi:hypothetical protein
MNPSRDFGNAGGLHISRNRRHDRIQTTGDRDLRYPVQKAAPAEDEELTLWRGASLRSSGRGLGLDSAPAVRGVVRRSISGP